MSNQAKDWQEGSYIVYVKGNSVTAIKDYGGKYGSRTYFGRKSAEAKCAPEDEFSLSMGVALAMDRLNKQLTEANDKTIKIGDKVRIKDYGKSYTTYATWIKKNIDDVGSAACFAYGQIPKADETKYIVRAIAPWGIEHEADKMLAYIQKYFVYANGKVDDNQPCYLIEVNGLEKV